MQELENINDYNLTMISQNTPHFSNQAQVISQTCENFNTLLWMIIFLTVIKPLIITLLKKFLDSDKEILLIYQRYDGITTAIVVITIIIKYAIPFYEMLGLR
jgi:hypothetical protein